MLEDKLDANCVADYASYDTGFVETAGTKAAAACPVVGVPAPGDFTSAAGYVSAYQDEFGEAPGTWSPYTYDSLRFLADGIEKAGGTEAKKLTAVLDAVRGRPGWTGSITIDPSNGNRRPATVVIVKTGPDGQLQVDGDWAAAVGAPYSG
jgi:ABC-type branched-subunit amino acid transport system substrate-binding protein